MSKLASVWKSKANDVVETVQETRGTLQLPTYEQILANYRDELSKRIPLLDLSPGSNVSALLEMLAKQAHSMSDQIATLVTVLTTGKIPK